MSFSLLKHHDMSSQNYLVPRLNYVEQFWPRRGRLVPYAIFPLYVSWLSTEVRCCNDPNDDDKARGIHGEIEVP